jgi:hypothetical protein
MLALASMSALLAASAPAISTDAPRAEPPIHWGVAVGLAGRAAFGEGITPPGGATDEYARADLDLAAEVFTLRLGRWVELAPYFTVRLAGGVNEPLFRDAVDAANRAADDEAPDFRVTGSNDIEVGLGARVFPVRWGGLEPYVGVFGAYARSSVSVAPVDTSGGPFGSVPAASHAREGLALSGAIGARYGWSIHALGVAQLFAAAEARYTHGFWSGLDSSFRELVGPENLDLSRFGGFFWLGYQL